MPRRSIAKTRLGRSFWEPASEHDAIPAMRRLSRAERRESEWWTSPQSDADSSGGELMAVDAGRAGSSEERTVSYQPEERYWTDYLRIALPVIGLADPDRTPVVLGLRADWRRRRPTAADSGAPAVITPINESTPAPPTATAAVIAPTPGPPPTASPTARRRSRPPGGRRPNGDSEARSSSGDPSQPVRDLPVYDVGTMVETTAEVNLARGAIDGQRISRASCRRDAGCRSPASSRRPASVTGGR